MSQRVFVAPPMAKQKTLKLFLFLPTSCEITQHLVPRFSSHPFFQNESLFEGMKSGSLQYGGRQYCALAWRLSNSYNSYLFVPVVTCGVENSAPERRPHTRINCFTNLRTKTSSTKRSRVMHEVIIRFGRHEDLNSSSMKSDCQE